MPIPQNQIDLAVQAQIRAAQDEAAQVRLVAGPGTGKSSSIEKRVAWLLACGVKPEDIRCVSFTRASAGELQQRIRDYCSRLELPAASKLTATTLHSLGLGVLRASGKLAVIPTDVVLTSAE